MTLRTISVQLSYRSLSGYGASAGFKAGGTTGVEAFALLDEVGRELAMLAAHEGRGADFIAAVREAVAKAEPSANGASPAERPPSPREA